MKKSTNLSALFGIAQKDMAQLLGVHRSPCSDALFCVYYLNISSKLGLK